MHYANFSKSLLQTTSFRKNKSEEHSSHTLAAFSSNNDFLMQQTLEGKKNQAIEEHDRMFF